MHAEEKTNACTNTNIDKYKHFFRQLSARCHVMTEQWFQLELLLTSARWVIKLVIAYMYEDGIIANCWIGGFLSLNVHAQRPCQWRVFPLRRYVMRQFATVRFGLRLLQFEQKNTKRQSFCFSPKKTPKCPF